MTTTTTHLLVTLKSPDEIGAAEAQALLERALAWADIEAAAINDEGDPEAEDLAVAMRWLALEVEVDPVIKDSPPCQHVSDVIKAQDWPRRAGLDPNLVAPYGGSRVPADTLLDSHTDHTAAFLHQPKEITARRTGLDPNLVAPYDVRAPERTAAALERIENRLREAAAEIAKGPRVAIAFRKLSDGDAFYARGRLSPWEKIGYYAAVLPGSRLHYTFNPDETVYIPKE